MTVSEKFLRILYILEDENNPYGSKVNSIMPETVLDQVHDDQSPTNKTLREIIEDLRQEIITGGRGNIIFPVTSVQGRTGDVTLDAHDIGLDQVDNTPDLEKPLSEPQQAAITRMLNDYVPEVDWTRLEEHLADMDNPHGVTLSQINRDNALTTFVANLIAAHNTSTLEGVHADIRQLISSLDEKVDGVESRVDNKLDVYDNALGNHIEDPAAHAGMFEEKENRSNKVPSIGSESTYEQYPSARAVVEYIAAKLVEFASQFNNVESWIDDIQVVQSRSDLPAANAQSYRKAYLIRNGLDNSTEVAICRYQNSTYYWDYSTFTEHAMFDMTYFSETPNGLSINTTTIAQLVMGDASIVDYITNTVGSVIPSFMSNYYTKEEIDARPGLQSITLVPGTDDGSIRYYINGDQSTMSEDVFIKGLTNVAFMEKVTENEIADGAVQSNHILNRAVQSRHIEDKAIGATQLNSGYMTVLGNIDDSTTRRVQEISMQYLAEIIGPMVAAVTGLNELKESVTNLADRVAALEERIPE